MEGKNNHPILAPYDFTSVSDVALTHAAKFCQLSGKPLIVLNVEDISTQKFLKQHNQIGQFLNDRLKGICKNVSSTYNIKVSYLIRSGNILSIRKIADELSISFMFIGIDQPHSIASNVFKVIGTSPAPVYVVQGDIESKNIRNIIFPVDGFEETRQKITCAVKVAKLTSANVKLFSIKLNEREQQLSQEVRVKQIEKVLYEDQVPFTTEYAIRKENEFADELMEYAISNKGDIFILMKTPRTFFPNLFINPIDKKVLMNPLNIPSIYVNPRDVGRYN